LDTPSTVLRHSAGVAIPGNIDGTNQVLVRMVVTAGTGIAVLVYKNVSKRFLYLLYRRTIVGGKSTSDNTTTAGVASRVATRIAAIIVVVVIVVVVVTSAVGSIGTRVLARGRRLEMCQI
jgi:hypothetical protein